MALQLIGAGFGRTGTLSLKSAIERLGAGPCYHMLEVVRHPGHADTWLRAADGESVDWDALFENFAATVDWPGCSFWRELRERYPEAKLLLSVRTPESWYESVYNTIYQAMSGTGELPEAVRTQMAMARKIVLENTFDGRFEDRAHAMGVFERHNQKVQRSIPSDQLLVYPVGAGWEPLCRFIDVPVPDEDFPHVNKSEVFHELTAAMRKNLMESSE